MKYYLIYFELIQMKYYQPMKLFAMINGRAIEKKLPHRFMSLDLRIESVAVAISTPDNNGVEVLSGYSLFHFMSFKINHSFSI